MCLLQTNFGHMRPVFLSPLSSEWKTGMMWETRHSPAHYHPQQLSEDVRRKLEHAHQQVQQP